MRNWHACREAGRRTGEQAGGQAGRRTGRHACMQTPLLAFISSGRNGSQFGPSTRERSFAICNASPDGQTNYCVYLGDFRIFRGRRGTH